MGKIVLNIVKQGNQILSQKSSVQIDNKKEIKITETQGVTVLEPV